MQAASNETPRRGNGLWCLPPRLHNQLVGLDQLVIRTRPAASGRRQCRGALVAPPGSHIIRLPRDDGDDLKVCVVVDLALLDATTVHIGRSTKVLLELRATGVLTTSLQNDAAGSAYLAFDDFPKGALLLDRQWLSFAHLEQDLCCRPKFLSQLEVSSPGMFPQLVFISAVDTIDLLYVRVLHNNAISIPSKIDPDATTLASYSSRGDSCGPHRKVTSTRKRGYDVSSRAASFLQPQARALTLREPLRLVPVGLRVRRNPPRRTCCVSLNRCRHMIWAPSSSPSS